MKDRINRLVIFTAHYPYTNGESFLEDEMKYVARLFKEIVIVTLEKNPTSSCYYIPKHAKIIECRRNTKRFEGLLKAVLHVLQPSAIGELCWGCREQGVKKFLFLIKRMLITERNITYIEKTKTEWYSDKKTLYYAYWLDSEATYLSRIREQLNGICIARTHGQDCFFDRDYHPYRRLQLRSLDTIYPISGAGKCDILEHYGHLVEGLYAKVSTIYLGVHFTKNKVNPWTKACEATIVSCAEVKRLKRIDLLIDALAILDIPIHWIHFGEGELMNSIIQYANQQLGSKRNVRYEFTGRVLKSEIMKFYETHSVDLLVNTSDQEGIPVSIMEAMAYGIPVIARNIGGNSELVDNTCGVLLNSAAKAEDVAVAIKNIICLNVDQRERLSQCAQTRISDNFSDAKNFEKLYSKYL